MPSAQMKRRTAKSKKKKRDKIFIVNGTENPPGAYEREGFDIHYTSDLKEASRLAEEFDSQCLVLGTLTAEELKSGSGERTDGITKIRKSLQNALTTVKKAMSLAGSNDCGSGQLAVISNISKSLEEAMTIVTDDKDKESEGLMEREEGLSYVIKPFEDAELTARLRGLLSTPGEVAELKEETLRLESLVSIITSVLSSLDIEDIRSVIVNKLAEAIQTKDCSVLLLKKDYDECFVLESARELPNKEMRVDLNNYPELKEGASIRRSSAGHQEIYSNTR